MTNKEKADKLIELAASLNGDGFTIFLACGTVEDESDDDASVILSAHFTGLAIHQAQLLSAAIKDEPFVGDILRTAIFHS